MPAAALPSATPRATGMGRGAAETWAVMQAEKTRRAQLATITASNETPHEATVGAMLAGHPNQPRLWPRLLCRDTSSREAKLTVHPVPTPHQHQPQPILPPPRLRPQPNSLHLSSHRLPSQPPRSPQSPQPRLPQPRPPRLLPLPLPSLPQLNCPRPAPIRTVALVASASPARPRSCACRAATRMLQPPRQIRCLCHLPLCCHLPPHKVTAPPTPPTQPALWELLTPTEPARCHLEGGVPHGTIAMLPRIATAQH